MKALLEFLAFFCHVCPLCIFARAFPDSKFAKGMKEFGKICPFCSAHQKLNEN